MLLYRYGVVAVIAQRQKWLVYLADEYSLELVCSTVQTVSHKVCQLHRASNQRTNNGNRYCKCIFLAVVSMAVVSMYGVYFVYYYNIFGIHSHC